MAGMNDIGPNAYRGAVIIATAAGIVIVLAMIFLF